MSGHHNDGSMTSAAPGRAGAAHGRQRVAATALLGRPLFLFDLLTAHEPGRAALPGRRGQPNEALMIRVSGSDRSLRPRLTGRSAPPCSGGSWKAATSKIGCTLGP